MVDPELERQLAAGEGSRVEAVFTLRPPEGCDLMEEGEVRRAVDRIVQSAQASAGQEGCDVHVMPLAQSFSVAAPAGVVRAILKAGGIASAMANNQTERLAIDPPPRAPRQVPRRGGGKTRKGDD